MVDSPCTNVCVVDGEFCVGCGRTVAEIASWQSMGDEERAKVVRAIHDGERPYPKPD